MRMIIFALLLAISYAQTDTSTATNVRLSIGLIGATTENFEEVKPPLERGLSVVYQVDKATIITSLRLIAESTLSYAEVDVEISTQSHDDAQELMYFIRTNSSMAYVISNITSEFQQSNVTEVDVVHVGSPKIIQTSKDDDSSDKTYLIIACAAFLLILCVFIILQSVRCSVKSSSQYTDFAPDLECQYSEDTSTAKDGLLPEISSTVSQTKYEDGLNQDHIAAIINRFNKKVTTQMVKIKDAKSFEEVLHGRLSNQTGDKAGDSGKKRDSEPAKKEPAEVGKKDIKKDENPEIVFIAGNLQPDSKKIKDSAAEMHDFPSKIEDQEEDIVKENNELHPMPVPQRQDNVPRESITARWSMEELDRRPSILEAIGSDIFGVEDSRDSNGSLDFHGDFESFQQGNYGAKEQSDENIPVKTDITQEQGAEIPVE